MGRNLISPIMCDTAADLAALFDGAKMIDKTIAQVSQIGTLISGVACTTGGLYRWVTGSVSPDNNQSQLIVVPGTNPASGKWVRCDPVIDLILPITFATANNAVLATIPAGITLQPIYSAPFWEMITAWGGGVAATIGLTWSNQTGSGSIGGLLGGPGGDGSGATAFPVTSYYHGTIGNDYVLGSKAMILNPTAQIIYERINSAHTQGTGNAHVPCVNIFAPIIPVSPS